MRIRKTLSLVMAAAALSACGEMQDDAVETQTGEIIRATSNGGRNEVVMLYAVVVINGPAPARTTRRAS
jgi:hypothetical protein